MKAKQVILVIALALVVGAVWYLEGLKADPGDQNRGETASDVTPRETSQGLEGGRETTTKVNQESLSPEVLARIAEKKEEFDVAPELTGISGYLNTDEIKLSDFRGKVVLVDFWTYTCINCIRTLPYLTEWDRKYREKGLIIIGVHTPEFEFEKKRENVAEAIEKHGIEYAVVQDNDYATWRAYKNRYWPRKYLVDQDGFIRYDHIGEGAYEKTEQIIQALLSEINGQHIEEGTTEEVRKSRRRTTPELYAGAEFALQRGQNIGNKEGLQPFVVVDYKLPNELKPDVIYVEGTWLSNRDNLEAMSDGAIVLEYTAGEVNIVGDAIKPVVMEVYLDGVSISADYAGSDVEITEEHARVMIAAPDLYNLINGEPGQHRLRLEVEQGFSFNAFTFG